LEAFPNVRITGRKAICASDTSKLSRWIGGKWTSNNFNVARVDSLTGIITAVSGGKATFTFTVDGSGCEVVSDTLTVYFPDTLRIDTMQTTCTGFAVTYTTSDAGYSSFTWSRATVEGINEPANSGTGNINEVLTNTTDNPITVIYTISFTVNGCTNTQDVTVVVVPRRRPSITIKVKTD
jgi:hypothetical protein